MEIIHDELGALLLQPRQFKDERGMFAEFYKKSAFVKLGIVDDFIQDNYSKSCYAVLRGLHYQKQPYSQAKLVRCIEGVIFDVAVDIRRNSSTFGRWVGYELSSQNQLALYVPHGFAHGFLVLSPTADVLYKVSGSEYNKDSDAGIRYDDQHLMIQWPKLDCDYIISDKDKLHSGLYG
jgi:dTDP-4-dehydrorhamnose 3,5-epimerase